MARWIRRNGRALLIVLLMMNLIVITVTRPAWQDNIGYLRPKVTVPVGQSMVIGGVRWQLSKLTLPDESELRRYSYGAPGLDELPPNSRFAAYIWQRTKDGEPAGVPPGYFKCELLAVSGDRQWTKQGLSLGIKYWAKKAGNTTLCMDTYTGPLVYVAVVPVDVRLTSIDVHFIPDSWSDKKRVANNSDLLVVRFDTD